MGFSKVSINVVEEFTVDTLEKLALNHLTQGERKVITQEIDRIFGKAAIQFILDQLPETFKRDFLERLDSTETRDLALRKICALAPEFEQALFGKLCDYQTEVIDAFRQQLGQALEYSYGLE